MTGPTLYERTVPYVTWGGGHAELPATTSLGWGARPMPTRQGPRHVIWDIAYGYVNGFPASAIAYYVLTRSLHWRISRWAFRREGYRWDDEHRCPIAKHDTREAQ